MGCWNDPDVEPCGIVTTSDTTQFGNQVVTILNEKYIVYDTTLIVNVGDYICVDSLGHTLSLIVNP